MPNGPQIAYHQSAPPRQTGRASSGILKSLWHRVEKGLDGLADVEDAVADRAKGIGNAIATRTTTLVARRSHVPSSNEPPRTIPQPPVRKFKKEQIDKPSVTASDNLIGSFGAKYKNIKAGSLKRRNEAKYEHLKTQSRKLDWNNIASGGRQVVGGDTSRRTVTEAPPSSWYSQQQQTHPQQQQPIRPPRPLASGDAATEPLMQAQDSSVPSSHPVPDDDDDDDDVYLGEKPSLFSKISMPRLPRLPSPIMRLLGKGSGSFNSRTQAAMEQWKDSESSIRRNKPRRYQTSKGTSGLASTSSIPDPVANLLNRSSKRPGSLLTNRDASKAKFVGQQQALFDVAFLLFFLIGIHQLLPSFADAGLILPRSLSELWSVTLPKVSTVLLSALQQESWMLYAAAGAFLTTISRIVLIDGQKDVLANSVGTAVERMTRYSQLYKRLVGSIPIDRRSQGRMRDAVESEVRDLVAGNRLQSFVITTMIAMVVMTVPVVMPICEALWRGIIRVIAMDGWHSWPLPYQEIAEGLKNIALSQFGQISTLISAEVPKALDNPMLVLFQVTTVAALLILAGPPAVARRGAGPTQEVDDDEEEEEYLIRTAESLRGTLNNLGSSSAARLGVLSKKGAAGSALERWWSAFPSDPSRSRSFSPLTFLRQVGFGLAATALAASPAVVYFVALHPTASCCPSGLIPPFRWDSVVDVSFLMLAALSLSWQAIRAGLAVSDTRSQTVDFITQLASLTTEVAGNTDLSTETQFGSTIVPAKGLSVRDLWASHAFVSAWAVRGANLDCAGGEVILVLGDEASGKTRLLTAVAESIIAPPRTALTTTKVRGTVSICGVDVSKWDQGMLKRRLGLLLSDVRSQSDVADLLSGMTVGEILEPVVGSVMSQSNVAAKRSAISQAMKITGLTSTLQRFPAKLGAVLSPKEDEVVPSDARPSSNLLSPSEWSKLLLTRVVAQAIHDNDSVSTDYLLLGSVLILDGVLSWMNEVDEARLIQKLRSTGAASVLTSHKWATGRFADRVCVVKDGAVIESGSHAELLSRGPQGSLYAAKWLAMSQS
uniref:ABC transporter domain-containing protein n=2 Tax=Grammatophora oceanica TaxID=210454 RepID=A0A7S1YDK3_9STRA